MTQAALTTEPEQRQALLLADIHRGRRPDRGSLESVHHDQLVEDPLLGILVKREEGLIGKPEQFHRSF